MLHDITLITRIDDCFLALTGMHLPCPPGASDRYQWLHEAAPYSILAHNTDADPHFLYANHYALGCFKYTRNEMLALPSRLSAAAQDRRERERLLNAVTHHGIAYDYTGPRVDKYSRRFMIYDGIVWQLRSADGNLWGQAALFWRDEGERPGWYNVKSS